MPRQLQQVVVDPDPPVAFEHDVELAVTTWRCLVDAWPGRSRQKRAPSVSAPSCFARSVLRTPIWFDGRQNASPAGRTE